MEWTLQNLIQFLPIAISLGLPLYMYRRSAREKKEVEEKDDKLELTTEILADGASIRKERGEQLKVLGVKYDRLVEIIESLRKDVYNLTGKLNNASFMNLAMEREIEKLKADNAKLLIEKDELTRLVDTLRGFNRNG